MARRIDPRIHNNFLDAHVLDRTGGPDDALVDEILVLARSLKISLMLPHSVKAEIEHPNTPAEVKRRALGLIYTERVSLTESERALHRQAREIVRGNARPGKHDRDAFHVVEAEKYGGGYFVTNDARLLKKRAELERVLAIAIVTPTEFLQAYRRFEAERR
jgi:predicted nucleic acid-binding protein